MMLSDPFCIRLIVLAPLEIIWWKSNGMNQLFSNWKGVAKDFQGDLEIFQKSRWWRGVGRGTKSSPEGLPRQILRIVFLTENGEMCSALIDEGFSISVIFGLKLNSSFPNFR